MNLCRALDDTPPRLFIGLTSIIGVTGMGRNGWYGFSNEALDLLLRRFGEEHPETAIQCMAFSIWDEIGMGVRLGSTTYLAQRGISAIPAREGVNRFLQLAMQNPGESQVVVTARISGLDTCLPAPHPLPRASRFLERILFSFPGVEVVARARLSLEEDGYVRDHNWRGTYLFPTVFGLEAMAQAAAYAAGHPRFNSYRIEDITLERPIPVNPETGVEIEIRAEVLEREPESGGRRVRTVIGTEQTGFSVAHFAATFVLGAEPDRRDHRIRLPDRPLAINPGQDLYNSRLLFQGPPFQRISEIYTLDSAECVFRSRQSGGLEEAGTSDANEPARPWLIGDPYFRDSLLHAVQLPVSQHICLPFNIESIEHHPSEGDPSDTLTGIVKVEDRTSQEVRAAVTVVNDDGQVVERLTGYVLKVLEHHEEYPTAEEIVEPGRRDETIMRREIDERCARLGLERPEAAVDYVPGIHRLRKEERRKLVVPLLQSTAGRIEELGRDVSITWLKSGKPHFEGTAGEHDISLSHDHGTVFCVIGEGPQGIDVQLMTSRAEDEWIGLLSRQSEPLMNELIASGDSLDRAGTRVWTAREAFFKAAGSPASRLRIKKRDGETVLFLADADEGHESILSFPVTLTRGPERMVAIAARPSGRKDRVPAGQPLNLLAKKLDFDMEAFKFDIEEGPRREPVFTFHFPVTFREAANPSRTLYFSQYFDWIGKLREYMVQPLYEELVEKFSSGRWGMVTNHAETQIAGMAGSGDIIEGRLWLEAITGSEQSTAEFRFEWRKITPGGTPETIAFSRMSTTWVAVLGHGIVEVQPFPEFGKTYLGKLLPSSLGTDRPQEHAEGAITIKGGTKLYQEPDGPAQASALLREDIFNTSLEDANLVGNIYFSNYYKWQGRVRDHFLHEAVPELFGDAGTKGELRCTKCSVNHLGEAMPFDRIAVRMYRASVFERAVRFQFDYYRLAPDGERRKLGHGEHEAVWHAPDAAGSWVPTELPASLKGALIPEKVRALKPGPSAMAKSRSGAYDVIVVGAGIGGLTTGALLAKRGRKVLLLEQHNKPGGFCTSFGRNVKHNGDRLRFVFEAGVHDIATFGEYSVTRRILRELGIADRVEWLRVAHEYFLPGRRIKVPRKVEDYINVLAGYYPREREALTAFFREVEICFREIYGGKLEKRRGKNLSIDKWKNVSLTEMLDRYIRDQQLKQILSVLACYITSEPAKLDALTALPLFGYYLEGGSYPKGGSQVLASALSASIEEHGGRVELKTPVEGINTESGVATGVRIAGGEPLLSDAVVSNADARRTFLELVGGDNLAPHFNQRMEKLRPSNSAFLVSLGVDFVPDVNPATFVIDDDKLLALMVPSRIDSSLAPPGYASISLLLLLPCDDANAWDRSAPDYSSRKKRYGDKMIRLAEKAVPDLRKHIIFRQDASPATFARYAWTTGGSIYGLAIDEWRPSMKTPIKGLFLAGANTTIRPGVEDAAFSGMCAADAVQEWLATKTAAGDTS